ncbi:hypothetical protein IPM65_04695 [Candidatus Roizmanbacteria bacterium]|nr:MAG: hypothetical protein IPM65_04695 [Candidatus Roizmanbacteria bacterium]
MKLTTTTIKKPREKKKYIFTVILSVSVALITVMNFFPKNISEKADNRDIQKFREIVQANIYEEIPMHVIDKYYDLIGIDAMLDVIEENPICHLHGHNIGKAVYRRTQDLAESFHICDDRCTTSCFHGVLMERFHPDNGTHVTMEELKKVTYEICNEENSSHTVPPGSCMHGIGHAAMFLADYNVQEAMTICSIFNDSVEQFQCATGAYMERDLYFGPEDAKKENFYPCEDSEYPAACYMYRVKYLTGKNTGEEIAQKCLDIKDKDEEVGCFYGLGYAYLLDIMEDPQLITSLCNYGTQEDHLACIDGSVGTIGIVQPDKAKEICTYVPDDEFKHCLKAAEKGTKFVEPNPHMYPH